MQIDWDVEIPMDDGLVVRADVFRPDGEGRHPVLMSYGPYAKGLAFQEGYPMQWQSLVAKHPEILHGSSGRYANWETADPERWVPLGYICIRVDSRGAGRSPGVVDPFSPREVRDFHDCIEWAARQPWSNGKIGLAGVSYYAATQWLVAATRPPHLAAICPFEGFSDFYRDACRHGGILNTFLREWYPRQVENVQHGLGMRGRVNPNTGADLRPGGTGRRGTARQPRRRVGPAPARGTHHGQLLRRTPRRPGGDRGARALLRQLGRARPAPARQRRGLPGRRLEAEVAGTAWPGALDRVLHGLWRRAAEALLRPFPQGRGQRLGPRAR